MTIDYHRLWQRVIGLFPCHSSSIHGPSHWRRVERNGLWLSSRTAADVTVVRLFALFHDSRRENDGTDDGHGARGAARGAELRGVLFELPDDAFDLLSHACRGHTDELQSTDPTIGTCWDADRLDLGRVGIPPSAKYLSTEPAREIARRGRVDRFLAECESGEPRSP